MPELPEVETMRRGIAPILGSRITRVWSPRSRLCRIDIRPAVHVLSRRVAGRFIGAVERVGKRVVLRLEGGLSVVLEPRMTGRILLAEPPNTAHLRVIFELEGGTAPRLLFWDVRGLGVVRLLTADEAARELGPEKLGPDALEVSAETLRANLAASRRAIKVALLDQRAVLGIGNIYASEILHRARISPQVACRQLRPADWVRLHAAMQEVLQEAVVHQGSTLRDGQYRNAGNQPGGFQHLHRVYERAGLACLQCGEEAIVRLVQAQRSTYFCPRCQRPRRLAATARRVGG